MCRIRLFFLFSFLSLSLLCTDRHLLDSMVIRLKASSSIPEKLNCLYTLSFEYGLIEPRKGLEYGRQCLDLATRHNNLKYQYCAYNGMANCYETLALFDSSIYCNFKCLEIARKIGEKKFIAVTLLNAAIGYKELGAYKRSLSMLLTGLKLIENDSDYNPRIHVYISDLYYCIGDYKRAEEHAIRGLKKVDEIHHVDYVGFALVNNLGKCLLQRGKVDSAIVLLSDNLSNLKKHTDELSICICLDALGEAWMLKGNYGKAADYFKEEQRLQQALKNENGICFASLNLAKSLAQLGKNWFPDVIKNLGIAEENLPAIKRNLDLLRKAYAIMAQTYEKIEKLDKALFYQKEFQKVSDVLLGKEKMEQLQTIQAKYETEKKEKKIEMQQFQLEKSQIYLKQDKLQILLLIVALGFVVVFGSLFYLRYKSKQELKFALEMQRQEQLMQKAVAEKEMEERDRIARDIHDEMGSGLSKISLLSDFALRQFDQPEKTKDTLKNISSTAQSLTQNMRELIWALNSEEKNLDDLVFRIRELVNDFFDELEIDVEFNLPDEIPALPLSKIVQRNVMMVVREVVNNCVKHAHASRFLVKFACQNQMAQFVFSDNGTGFDVNLNTKAGNGIRNMRKRLMSCGGTVEFQSANPGTTIVISFPV